MIWAKAVSPAQSAQTTARPIRTNCMRDSPKAANCARQAVTGCPDQFAKMEARVQLRFCHYRASRVSILSVPIADDSIVGNLFRTGARERLLEMRSIFLKHESALESTI